MPRINLRRLSGLTSTHKVSSLLLGVGSVVTLRGGTDAVPGSQRNPAIAAPVWSVGAEEAEAGQNQEATRGRGPEPRLVESHQVVTAAVQFVTKF